MSQIRPSNHVHLVSPYLRAPLRSLEEVLRERGGDREAAHHDGAQELPLNREPIGRKS